MQVVVGEPVSAANPVQAQVTQLEEAFSQPRRRAAR
jgi:hypothetical protein